MGLIKKSSSKKYLFTDSRNSFPVVEFISSSDESLNIPAFILETTWPRVLYFYYPNHSKFNYFHNDFVHVARHIRHESDILVLFYAISCSAHTSMCTNSDLIKHSGVPLLKAYESESTQGTEILIESKTSTIENMNRVVNQLSSALSLGDFSNIKAPSVPSTILNQSENPEDGKNTDIGNMIANELILQETYSDALIAFMMTIEYNIFGDLNEVKNDEPLELSQQKADVLRDFLDLCYWASPPSWKIHEVLLRLRSEFNMAIKSPKNLKAIVSDHSEFGKANWSENCKTVSKTDKKTKGINNSSYSCGLWKLLHIISVGASEARKKVMGDVIRIRPAYVSWVIRDFISEFIPDEKNKDDILQNRLGWCKGCRDRLISSYDSCKQDILCINNVSSNSQLTTESSKVVAEWLWRSHEESKVKSHIKKKQISKKKFEYDITKLEYWPSDLKIVRIAVLKKIGRVLPQIEHHAATSKDRFSENPLSVVYAVLSMIVFVLTIRRLKGFTSKRRKSK
jgi:hypothetical protein